jgi:hypothetical protein
MVTADEAFARDCQTRERVPSEHVSHRKRIVAYLACVQCGKWWGCTQMQVRHLLAPFWFACPLCHSGRKHIDCWRDWDKDDRVEPSPSRLHLTAQGELPLEMGETA